MFTVPLLRNGLHNPVIPPLLGEDDIENTASSIVAWWTVFTELLPGNALIKSVTIFSLFPKVQADSWAQPSSYLIGIEVGLFLWG
jgi:hypothetical protein